MLDGIEKAKVGQGVQRFKKKFEALVWEGRESCRESRKREKKEKRANVLGILICMSGTQVVMTGCLLDEMLAR